MDPTEYHLIPIRKVRINRRVAKKLLSRNPHGLPMPNPKGGGYLPKKNPRKPNSHKAKQRFVRSRINRFFSIEKDNKMFTTPPTPAAPAAAAAPARPVAPTTPPAPAAAAPVVAAPAATPARTINPWWIIIPALILSSCCCLFVLGGLLWNFLNHGGLSSPAQQPTQGPMFFSTAIAPLTQTQTPAPGSTSTPTPAGAAPVVCPSNLPLSSSAQTLPHGCILNADANVIIDGKVYQGFDASGSGQGTSIIALNGDVQVVVLYNNGVVPIPADLTTPAQVSAYARAANLTHGCGPTGCTTSREIVVANGKVVLDSTSK